MKFFMPFLILMTSFLFFSCAIDEESPIENSRGIAYPDIHLENATYKVSRGDNSPIFVQGEIIEIYKEINKTYIHNASFVQYNRNKEIILEGTFGEGEINTQTNDLELQNSVSFTIYPDELTIEGMSITYNSDLFVVKGKENEVITLSNKKGDILKGKGFQGNIEKKIFEFSELEEGVLNYD